MMMKMVVMENYLKKYRNIWKLTKIYYINFVADWACIYNMIV